MLEVANPTTPYMMLKSCIGDRCVFETYVVEG
jgi:hypothetical protein